MMVMVQDAFLAVGGGSRDGDDSVADAGDSDCYYVADGVGLRLQCGRIAHEDCDTRLERVSSRNRAAGREVCTRR